mgnify:CR=1 FL=1
MSCREPSQIKLNEKFSFSISITKKNTTPFLIVESQKLIGITVYPNKIGIIEWVASEMFSNEKRCPQQRFHLGLYFIVEVVPL